MFTYMRAWLASKGWLTREEEGASLVEYGLLVALIAVACVAAVAAIGKQVNLQFEAIQKALGG